MQLGMYGLCGESYRRSYIENEKIPPGFALIGGKVFHKPAEINFRQKIESREDLPITDFREIAAATFEAEIAGGYSLSEEESARGAKIVIGEAKDRSIEMVEFHAKQQAPDYQPILVEEKVRVELPGTHDLLGVIDLADVLDRVIDFKTAARPKSQSEADSSIQLTSYHAAFLAKTGREPSGLLLDTVVKTKTKTTRQSLTTVRTEQDFSALAQRINTVTDAISKGVFPPAAVGAWNCAAKWCGYYSTCKYVNSERKAASDHAS